MRLLLLLVLVSGVRAEPVPDPAPYVRWIDKTGAVQRVTLGEVVSESVSEVTLVPKGATKPQTIPMARVLTFVRERPDRNEEVALRDARFDVAAGLRGKEARPVLDRLAREGSKPWIREYAAAARALLAEAEGEEDRGARLDAFLKAYPESRFVCAIHRARARELGRQRMDAPDPATEFREVHALIVRLGGSFVDRYATLSDAAVKVAAVTPSDAREYFGPAFETEIVKKVLEEHFAEFSVEQCALKRVVLVLREVEAREIIAEGEAPRGPAAKVRELIDECELYLPELKCDLRLSYGRMLAACKEPKKAREAFEQALELAPDPGRRRAARALLGSLGDG